MGQIVYVNPHEVILSSRPRDRDVQKQKELLAKQGQIVPLLAMKTYNGWKVLDTDYPYSSAQVQAAREQGWDTVILTDSLDET